MKRIKNIFGKKKEESLESNNSAFSSKKGQGNIETDSNISDQSSSIIIIGDEEISLAEDKGDENWKLSDSYREELESISLSKGSIISESEKKSIQVEEPNNAQKWLDENYPKKIRNKVRDLYVGGKELEGSLDLRDFCNLERLDCSWNKLAALYLNKSANLIRLDCRNNQLVNFDFTSLNPKKLISVFLTNNNLHPQDLSCFQTFVNLESLDIGNNDEKQLNQNIYNRFYGSLEYLKDLNKLQWLNIANTDINDGIGYLPNRLIRIGMIHYSTTYRPESKVKEIEKELTILLNSAKEEENWKEINPKFDQEKQREWERLRFDYQQVKEWIKVGLQPDDYHYASYLRGKGIDPKQELNWEELKKENRSAQWYLDKKYPLEEKRWVNWLDISRSGLEGDLVIDDFPNLERIDCRLNQITSLTLSNLPKLTYLAAVDNKLTNLVINNYSEINRLEVRNNFLTNLDFLNALSPDSLVFLDINNNIFFPQNIDIFSKFRNLKYLNLIGNHFYGNLQSLRNLSKLEQLIFAGNEIDGGLEYLPDSLNQVSLVPSELTLQDKSSLKLIGRSTPLRKGNIFVDNPYYDFKHWKENQPYFKWLKEELEKLNPNLNVYDILKNVFFNVRTGEFVGNHQAMTSLLNINKSIIDEKEKKINFLELNIKELSNQISSQWKKVHNAYLYCVSKPEEKELLDQLIKERIEFTKFKKQWLSSPDYRKKSREYKNHFQAIESRLEELLEGRLEVEIVEETMNKVEQILTECEEITNWQLELEEKINNKSLLLEEKKQVPQITINREDIKLLSENIGSKLILYQKENEKSKDELKRLQQELQSKKVQRQELLTALQNQLVNTDDKEWLKTLITIQKKSPDSAEVEQIKEILESHKISREQLEELCQIQKEISELKQKKNEQEQLDLTAQIEVIPSGGQSW